MGQWSAENQEFSSHTSCEFIVLMKRKKNTIFISCDSYSNIYELLGLKINFHPLVSI